MGMQYHLQGSGFSGRGVRVRYLDPAEVEETLTTAAKLVGTGASIIELKKVEWRNGVKRMITAYTEPCENPMAEGVKWRKASLADLEDLKSAGFMAKDVLFLEHIYRNFHEVIPSEVEAITGKAVPTSEG